MPFSALLLRQDEEIRRLVARVFDETWATISASRSPLSQSADNVQKARRILAKWLITKVQQGERDGRKLSEDATLHKAILKLPPHL